MFKWPSTIEQDKNNLIRKILHNYYEGRLIQQEIALKYYISRIKVSRMIGKTLADKVVQIKINLSYDPVIELERRLEEL